MGSFLIVVGPAETGARVTSCIGQAGRGQAVLESGRGKDQLWQFHGRLFVSLKRYSAATGFDVGMR
jgi:hypothetical protein